VRVANFLSANFFNATTYGSIVRADHGAHSRCGTN
jgi:hypothetical protein